MYIKQYISYLIKKMSEIDVSEIFQKLRTKQDIKNFFRELSKCINIYNK